MKERSAGVFSLEKNANTSSVIGSKYYSENGFYRKYFDKRVYRSCS